MLTLKTKILMFVLLFGLAVLSHGQIFADVYLSDLKETYAFYFTK